MLKKSDFKLSKISDQSSGPLYEEYICKKCDNGACYCPRCSSGYILEMCVNCVDKIVGLVVLIMTPCQIVSAIKHLANPEYYAIHEILSHLPEMK